MNKTFIKTKKGKRAPKKKTNNLTTLKNKLWTITREVIIKRDKSTCQWCGKYVEGNNRHVSHVIPKARGNIYRFDLLNLKILCYRCHIKWHDSPIESMRWFEEKFPERLRYIESLQHKTLRFKKQDIEQMIEERS